MGDYESLKVWQRAHQITLEVYQLSASFPAAERYALTSQVRRSAVSIPSNPTSPRGRGAIPSANSPGSVALHWDLPMSCTIRCGSHGIFGS